jgi:hypothetical protein
VSSWKNYVGVFCATVLVQLYNQKMLSGIPSEDNYFVPVRIITTFTGVVILRRSAAPHPVRPDRTRFHLIGNFR